MTYPRGGLFWSQISIPGKPSLLIVDGSGNIHGWEAEFCNRITDVLRRKGLDLVGTGAPFRPRRPEDLGPVLSNQDAFNCIFLFCHGEEALALDNLKLKAFWEWLTQDAGLTSKLLAVCTCQAQDLATARTILAAKDTFAQLAIVPESPLGPRAAGLFFMKFFSELQLHSSESITGKMVWFSFSKAKELLKRRQLWAPIDVRC